MSLPRRLYLTPFRPPVTHLFTASALNCTPGELTLCTLARRSFPSPDLPETANRRHTLYNNIGRIFMILELPNYVTIYSCIFLPQSIFIQALIKPANFSLPPPTVPNPTTFSFRTRGNVQYKLPPSCARFNVRSLLIQISALLTSFSFLPTFISHILSSRQRSIQCMLETFKCSQSMNTRETTLAPVQLDVASETPSSTMVPM